MNRELWDKAVAFHGHICGGIAIGVRASMEAIKRLNITFSEDEELVCVTENDACGVDAVQAILGCTIGKGNLIYYGTGKMAFNFYNRKTGDSFRLIAKPKKKGGNIALISFGWDPGLFSLSRAFMTAVVPSGENYTFWGKGVSQGHSDAVRRIKGVKDARQYTIPVESALDAVRAGENPELSTREKHTRYCYVVAEEGADTEAIRNEIVTMPAYFADYDTTVEFISEEEMAVEHSGLPHGGFVIRSGKTGWNEENKAICEFKLDLDSNPEFTSSVIVAYARAAYRMACEGFKGCKTIFDVPISYASSMSPEEMRKMML